MGIGQTDESSPYCLMHRRSERKNEDIFMNEEQLEQLVQRSGADILRFCRITAGNREDGDELYQDTMLTLLEKLNRLNEGQNVKSYAISVAMKLWKGRNRKLARRFRLAPQESLDALMEQGFQTGSQGSPEEMLLRQVQVQQVRRLVGQLPEQYRLPIQLYYSAGLTVCAIAEVLKIPENTVKSRLHRGKKLIRTKLEELDNDRTGI